MRPVATVERPADTLISLTPVAAAKIRELLAEEPDGDSLVLRVAIQGGGCSGFQYGLGFDAGPAEGDLELEVEGVPVVIDPFSAPYLRGTTIDFLNTIQESGFKIENPNAVSSCGCGHSFTVAEGEDPGVEPAYGCGPACSH
jgi:iron-sulfur cluster assembly protein